MFAWTKKGKEGESHGNLAKERGGVIMRRQDGGKGGKVAGEKMNLLSAALFLVIG